MILAHTTEIQRCVERLDPAREGDRDELLRLTHGRLLSMVRALIARYPQLRRWEQSDDVLANVHVRLLRCLAQVQVTSARHFLSLAATNMRRELIDLCRHYYGDEGPGRNHATPARADGDDWACRGGDPRGRDPAVLAEWAELHERISQLPEDEREVVDMHWYHGLTHERIACLLDISARTVKRRWMAAKDRLASRLD